MRQYHQLKRLIVGPIVVTMAILPVISCKSAQPGQDEKIKIQHKQDVQSIIDYLKKENNHPTVKFDSIFKTILPTQITKKVIAEHINEWPIKLPPKLHKTKINYTIIDNPNNQTATLNIKLIVSKFPDVHMSFRTTIEGFETSQGRVNKIIDYLQQNNEGFKRSNHKILISQSLAKDNHLSNYLPSQITKEVIEKTINNQTWPIKLPEQFPLASTSLNWEFKNRGANDHDGILHVNLNITQDEIQQQILVEIAGFKKLLKT